MRNVLIIWRKELRDTIRDRRTLLVMVVVPIFLMPLLLVAVGQVATSGGKETYIVAISGAANGPDLLHALRADRKLTIRTQIDPYGGVRDKKAAAALLIPPGFAGAIHAGRPSALLVIEDSTRTASSAAAGEVQSALATFSRATVAARLRAHRLDPVLLHPIDLRASDVATRQERSGFLLSFILPLFIVIWAITGGMYTAMDVSAGEKERATLEALLLTPSTRLEITLGKLLAVATVGFLTIVAAITSMVVTLSAVPISSGTSAGGADLTVHLEPRVVPVIFALGILMAIAFSALELALGILARSFKEAQSYITPLYLASILPVAVINSIPGLEPPPVLYLIPAVNAVLLFKEALLGQATFLHSILTMLSLLAFAALAIAVTVGMFRREQVLLKT